MYVGIEALGACETRKEDQGSECGTDKSPDRSKPNHRPTPNVEESNGNSMRDFMHGDEISCTFCSEAVFSNFFDLILRCYAIKESKVLSRTRMKSHDQKRQRGQGHKRQ